MSKTSNSATQPNVPFVNSIPSRPNLQNPLSPNSQRTPNLPNNLRRVNQPNLSLSRQQDPQLQQAIGQNLLMQQTMMNEQLNQYRLQDMVKQQLLTYAIDAPTENLQRELKNSNAFVRWAASVELNRRWKQEKAVAVAEARMARETAIPATVVEPRRIRAATPALVTSTSRDQALLLQYGIPNPQ